MLRRQPKKIATTINITYMKVMWQQINYGWPSKATPTKCTIDPRLSLQLRTRNFKFQFISSSQLIAYSIETLYLDYQWRSIPSLASLIKMAGCRTTYPNLLFRLWPFSFVWLANASILYQQSWFSLLRKSGDLINSWEFKIIEQVWYCWHISKSQNKKST